MATQFENFSANPLLTEYAQGLMLDRSSPLADFIAPPVDVPAFTGKFKQYSAKNRFRVPQTLRNPGDRAAMVRFNMQDGTFNCAPNAIDVPVDEVEGMDIDTFTSSAMEAATLAADIGFLSHEQIVIERFLAIHAGTSKTWDANADPIADIDAAIKTVMLAAGGMSSMEVGIVAGPGAWIITKNHVNVRNRFVVGNPDAANTGTPTVDALTPLFLANPQVRVSMLAWDTAPEGKPETISYGLDNQVIVFLRRQSPTRLDPSTMKTFRRLGHWMKPRQYMRDDNRVAVFGFDWSADVQVTNSEAFVRYNVSAS